MTTIRQDHFIESVADALQYISYYHPRDYLEALGEAYRHEASAAARDAIAQILTNSRMCAEGAVRSARNRHRRRLPGDRDARAVGRRPERRGYGGRRRPPRVPPSRQSAPSIHRLRPGRREDQHARQHPAVIHMRVVPGDTVE